MGEGSQRCWGADIAGEFSFFPDKTETKTSEKLKLTAEMSSTQLFYLMKCRILNHLVHHSDRERKTAKTRCAEATSFPFIKLHISCV